jgi:hypothetical protein
VLDLLICRSVICMLLNTILTGRFLGFKALHEVFEERRIGLKAQQLVLQAYNSLRALLELGLDFRMLSDLFC